VFQRKCHKQKYVLVGKTGAALYNFGSFPNGKKKLTALRFNHLQQSKFTVSKAHCNNVQYINLQYVYVNSSKSSSHLPILLYMGTFHSTKTSKIFETGTTGKDISRFQKIQKLLNF